MKSIEIKLEKGKENNIMHAKPQYKKKRGKKGCG